MKTCIPSAAPIALLCSCLYVPLSHGAASAEPFSERAWEEVVVVASHVPRPAREVGSAVTLLTSDDIDIRKIDLGAELLREVPGLAVNRSGQVGNLTQVRIRGAEGNHTLVLIDGIEANDPGQSSEFNFADLMTWDVGRIEVLRGPQSALYGSDSIGGVISIESAEPDPGFDAHGEVQGGSFGTTQLGASVSGGSERVSGRLSAVRFDTDGISASAIDPEHDGYQTTTLHGTLDVELTPWLGARMVLRRTDNDVESDRQDFDFPPTPTEGLIVDSDEHTESTQRYGLVALTADLADGRWQHRVAAAYTDTESDTFSAGVHGSGTRGERKKLEYQTTVHFGNGAIRHAVTAGIQHEALEFRNISAVFPGANQHQDDQQTSYVAEYGIGYRGASLSLSIRHDDNDRFDDATTARITGSYLVEPSGTRLHASYGEGITNPTFTELFGFDPDTFVGNPDLAPERSDGYDLGFEQALLDGRALIDVTWFDATLTDEIITVFDFATFTSTVDNQAGESARRGVEVSARTRLSDAWSASGSYTYLHATDPDGQREVRRPRHTASANLNHTFMGGRGNFNLGALFNGAQDDLEFASSTPQSRVTLDHYLLLNAALTFDVNAAVQVFVRGENLLDGDYTEVYGYRSPGAAGYLGVRVRL